MLHSLYFSLSLLGMVPAYFSCTQIKLLIMNLRNGFTIIGILFFVAFACAQSKPNSPFAGKVFTIDNYINDTFDNTEDLTFTSTEVEGSICVQYGFEAAEYTVSTNEAGQAEFSCTMISVEHGKMVWTGVMDGERILGEYLWTKEGQDPIQYTFKGKLK